MGNPEFLESNNLTDVLTDIKHFFVPQRSFEQASDVFQGIMSTNRGYAAKRSKPQDKRLTPEFQQMNGKRTRIL